MGLLLLDVQLNINSSSNLSLGKTMNTIKNGKARTEG